MSRQKSAIRLNALRQSRCWRALCVALAGAITLTSSPAPLAVAAPSTDTLRPRAATQGSAREAIEAELKFPGDRHLTPPQREALEAWLRALPPAQVTTHELDAATRRRLQTLLDVRLPEADRVVLPTHIICHAVQLTDARGQPALAFERAGETALNTPIAIHRVYDETTQTLHLYVPQGYYARMHADDLWLACDLDHEVAEARRFLPHAQAAARARYFVPAGETLTAGHRLMLDWFAATQRWEELQRLVDETRSTTDPAQQTYEAAFNAYARRLLAAAPAPDVFSTADSALQDSLFPGSLPDIVFDRPATEERRRTVAQLTRALDAEFGEWTSVIAEEKFKALQHEFRQLMQQVFSDEQVINALCNWGIQTTAVIERLQATLTHMAAVPSNQARLLNDYLTDVLLMDTEEENASARASFRGMPNARWGPSVERIRAVIHRLTQWDFLHRFPGADQMRLWRGLEMFANPEEVERYMHLTPGEHIAIQGQVVSQAPTHARSFADPLIVRVRVPVEALRMTSWLKGADQIEPEIAVDGACVFEALFDMDNGTDVEHFEKAAALYERALRPLLGERFVVPPALHDDDAEKPAELDALFAAPPAALPAGGFAGLRAPANVETAASKWSWLAGGEEQAKKLVTFSAEDDARFLDAKQPLVLVVDLQQLAQDPPLSLQLEAMRRRNYFATQGGAVHLLLLDDAARTNRKAVEHAKTILAAVNYAHGSATQLSCGTMVTAVIPGRDITLLRLSQAMAEATAHTTPPREIVLVHAMAEFLLPRETFELTAAWGMRPSAVRQITAMTPGFNDVLSRELQFYLGLRRDHQGRTIEDLWRFDETQLEVEHDYIQLLFPSDRLGQFFALSLFGHRKEDMVIPALTPVDQARFREPSPLGRALRARMLRSLDQMLAFYGLHYVVKGDHVTIERSAQFAKRRRIWLTRENHNFLRLSRIVRSLRLAGLEPYAVQLYDALCGIAKEYPGVTGESPRHWATQIEGLDLTMRLPKAQWEADRHAEQSPAVAVSAAPALRAALHLTRMPPNDRATAAPTLVTEYGLQTIEASTDTSVPTAPALHFVVPQLTTPTPDQADQLTHFRALAGGG